MMELNNIIWKQVKNVNNKNDNNDNDDNDDLVYLRRHSIVEISVNP